MAIPADLSVALVRLEDVHCVVFGIRTFAGNTNIGQQLWVNCPINDAKVNSEIFSETGSVFRLNFLK